MIGPIVEALRRLVAWFGGREPVVLLVIFAVVGISRIYLGVHYPTDVLAGWMAGAVWALSCWLVTRWLQHRRSVET